jgi:hypothetical protein
MIPALLQKLKQLTLAQQFLLIFAVAFSIRVGLVLVTHQYTDLSRYELQRTAYSLATTGVFGNPYAIPTGPTAHVAPGYPLILAGIYRFFGAGTSGELVKEVVASAVCALQWALVPLAASYFSFPASTGFLAGLLGALLPFKLSVETKGDWEAIYSALAVMLIACVTIRIWRQTRFTVSDGIRSGLAWGISLLFYPAMLPLLACFLITGAFLARRINYWKFAAVHAALVVIVLMPWIIRNQIELGSPVATRTNFGLELRLSNNDLAGPLERDNYEHGVYHVYHPLQSIREAEKVRDMGEVAYNKMAMDDAITWISAHPANFIRLTAERLFYFWFQPVPGQRIKGAWLGVTSLLCFAGLYFVWRRDPLAALLLTLMLLILPLPNYLVHVGLRHRYPLDWICNLLTVFAIRMILRRS